MATDIANVTVAAAADMSPFALFWQADIVVKAVMIGLLFASIWSWAIIIERARRLKTIDQQTEAFENRFWKANSFEDIREVPGKAEHPATKVFHAAMSEWKLSTKGGRVDRVGLRTRLGSVMSVAIAREIDLISDRLNVLATIGSVSPFVGLFGTVWGIMRSFTSIAATQNTTLAVVAPGIAEALFATAMGLFAAIPAVIGYNRLLYGIGRLEGRLSNFAEEFQGELSRELDNLSAGGSQGQA
jgi:biopolymer transport protein TolQ